MSRWLGLGSISPRRTGSPSPAHNFQDNSRSSSNSATDTATDEISNDSSARPQCRRQSSETTVTMSRDCSRRVSEISAQQERQMENVGAAGSPHTTGELSESVGRGGFTAADVVRRLGHAVGFQQTALGSRRKCVDGVVRTFPEDDGDGGAAGGDADAAVDDDGDWEKISRETGYDMTLEGLDGDKDRPMSPGVDFSFVALSDNGNNFMTSSRLPHDDQVVLAAEHSEGGGARVGTGGGDEQRKWVDARDTHSFLVRGPTYLTDKGKRPAGAAMCRLLGFDCFVERAAGNSRIDHIASRGRCREKVEALTSGDKAPFLFIINIQVRGDPPVSMVAYWATDAEAVANPDGVQDPQQRTFAKIIASYADIPISTFGGHSSPDGDESHCPVMDETPPPAHSDERNRRFKLIPRIIGGSWVVRKAVGSTPVLLGTKIHHRYYRGARYVETDMDTGSSPTAASLCGRCRGLSRNIDVDLGIVLQANSAEELPEALLGAVRLTGFGVEDPDLQTKLF